MYIFSRPISQPHPVRKPRRRLQLLSLLAVVAYSAAIEWLFGWDHLWQAWAQIPRWQPLLALLLMLLTYLVRGLRIWMYFLPVTRRQLRLCCKIMLTHNLLNNLLPMRTGEASFPLLMRAYFQLTIARASAGLLLLRLLDLQVLMCIGWLAIMGFSGAQTWLWFSLPPLILSPLLLLRSRPWISRLQQRSRRPRLRAFLQQLLQALPRNLAQLSYAWALTWLCWGSKILVFTLVLRWFADTDWWSAMGACIGGELSSVLPLHAPGGLGTYEASMLAATQLLGIKGSWVVFAGVQLHLLIIVSTLLGGCVALVLPGTKQPNSAPVVKVLSDRSNDRAQTDV